MPSARSSGRRTRSCDSASTPCSRRIGGAPHRTSCWTSWCGSASTSRTRLRKRICPPAAFALAEHLTGVAISPALLQDTTFTCATVQVR
uniref:DUF6461 domain-containing protein n=1 Tax=Streptomyces avidinii TaxID=1895 RepID=UPI00227D96AC|nr:DUF6461 domain-containing protein [Streptomyces avidinii]